MPNRQAKYELTLFKPKSEDPTEAAALEQLEDAGQTFVVTTDPASSRPYLEVPEGRRGAIQIPERSVDSASISVRVLDRRVTGGATTVDRWVTRFSGDAKGRGRFTRLKARVREWDGADWQDMFTGRVHSSGLSGSKLWVELQLRDLVDELSTEVFGGAPHSSITYAQPSSLLPLGLPEPWGPFRTAAGDGPTPWLRGTYRTGPVGPTTGHWIDLDKEETVSLRSLVVKAFHDTIFAAAVGDNAQIAGSVHPPLIKLARVRMRLVSSPETVGEFWLAKSVVSEQHVNKHPYLYQGSIDWFIDERGRWRTLKVGLHPVATTVPGYMAPPANGTAVEFYVYRYGPPTPSAPLLIDEVHVATFIKDLLAGKFGPLSEHPDDGPLGSPLISFPADTAALADLEADESLGSVYLPITGPADLKEFLEKLNLGHELAYRIDEAGKYVPVDWRLSDLGGLETLTDEDLVAGNDSVDVQEGRDGAVTRVDVLHYHDLLTGEAFVADTEGIPDVATSVSSRQDREVVIFERYGDLSEAKLEVDAVGLRAAISGVLVSGQDSVGMEEVRRKARQVALGFRGPFGSGPRQYTLHCRRTSAADSCKEGDLRALDITAIPDPLTNRRGGTRLARCIERTPGSGPDLWLRFLDLGSDAVAEPPTWGAYGQNATSPRHAVDLAIAALNAAGDPVEIEYAITETSVGARPASTSKLWRSAFRFTAAGSDVIQPLPAGLRVWLRARSDVGGSADLKLPSAWVFPAGDSYVDTQALPAPTALVLAAAGASIVATWTPGDTSLFTQPVIAVSPGPAVPQRVGFLTPGSARYVFDELLPATTYVAGVRHVDGIGGVSAMVTAAQATSASTVLSAPRRLQLLQARAQGQAQVTAPEQASVGYGFWIGFLPTDALAFHRIQVSTSAVFASIEAERVIDGRVVAVQVARDAADAQRYVRVRSEREGYSSSPWSEVVSGWPTDLTSTPGAVGDRFAGGYAELVRRDDMTIELRVGDGGDSDSERAYYEVEVDPDPEEYPDVDEASPFIDADDMPFDGPVMVGLDPLVTPEAVYARVRFWSSGTGFGQEILLRLPAAQLRVEAVEVIVDASGVVSAELRASEGVNSFSLHSWSYRPSDVEADATIQAVGRVIDDGPRASVPSVAVIPEAAEIHVGVLGWSGPNATGRKTAVAWGRGASQAVTRRRPPEVQFGRIVAGSTGTPFILVVRDPDASLILGRFVRVDTAAEVEDSTLDSFSRFTQAYDISGGPLTIRLEVDWRRSEDEIATLVLGTVVLAADPLPELLNFYPNFRFDKKVDYLFHVDSDAFKVKYKVQRDEPFVDDAATKADVVATGREKNTPDGNGLLLDQTTDLIPERGGALYLAIVPMKADNTQGRLHVMTARRSGAAIAGRVQLNLAGYEGNGASGWTLEAPYPQGTPLASFIGLNNQSWAFKVARNAVPANDITGATFVTPAGTPGTAGWGDGGVMSGPTVGEIINAYATRYSVPSGPIAMFHAAIAFTDPAHFLAAPSDVLIVRAWPLGSYDGLTEPADDSVLAVIPGPWRGGFNIAEFTDYASRNRFWSTRLADNDVFPGDIVDAAVRAWNDGVGDGVQFKLEYRDATGAIVSGGTFFGFPDGDLAESGDWHDPAAYGGSVNLYVPPHVVPAGAAYLRTVINAEGDGEEDWDLLVVRPLSRIGRFEPSAAAIAEQAAVTAGAGAGSSIQQQESAAQGETTNNQGTWVRAGAVHTSDGLTEIVTADGELTDAAVFGTGSNARPGVSTANRDIDATQAAIGFGGVPVPPVGGQYIPGYTGQGTGAQTLNNWIDSRRGTWQKFLFANEQEYSEIAFESGPTLNDPGTVTARVMIATVSASGLLPDEIIYQSASIPWDGNTVIEGTGLAFEPEPGVEHLVGVIVRGSTMDASNYVTTQRWDDPADSARLFPIAAAGGSFETAATLYTEAEPLTSYPTPPTPWTGSALVYGGESMCFWMLRSG